MKVEKDGVLVQATKEDMDRWKRYREEEQVAQRDQQRKNDLKIAGLQRLRSSGLTRAEIRAIFNMDLDA